MSDLADSDAGSHAAADLIVSGRVVSMDSERRIIPDGSVVIRAGKIVAVGPRSEMTSKYRATRVLDKPDQIILPGFSDCHTHSTQSLVRGLIAAELPMIYRLYIPADMDLSPEEAALGTKLCAAQLALSGVTTMCDFAGDTSPEHEDAMIAAAAEVGVRVVFLRGNGDQKFHHASLYTQIKQRSSFKVIEAHAEQDLRRTDALIKRAAADKSQLFHAGVCPSSLLGYSAEYFKAAHALAKQHDVTMQVHAARDREEVEFCLSVFGCRPIERLAELEVIDERLVCVHAILATASELKLLGQARASIAHSAVETVNILNAVPSIQRMRAAGVTVGLGCDNAINDMFTVMHTAWALQVGGHGVQNYEPDCVTEDDLMTMATIDAAKLLRIDKLVGSIEVGKVADFVVLDGGGLHMNPLQAVPTDLVRFAGRANVRHVAVAGRLIVEDFQNTTIDRETLVSAVRPIGERLSNLVTVRRYRPLRGCC